MMRRFLLSILIVLSFSASAFATQQGYYDLENNGNDTSGNGRTGTIVGTPSYLTGTPIPLHGSYCMTGFSDTNYLSIPATVFTPSMSTTGKIVFSYFQRYADGFSGGPVLISGTFAGASNFFFQLNGSLTAALRYPTGGGGVANFTFPNMIVVGDWVTVVFQWNPSGVQLWQRVGSQATWTNYLNTTTVANFSGCTAINVGRFTASSGFPFFGVADSICFDDSYLLADPNPPTSTFLFDSLGHSYVLGTNDGGGCGGSLSNDDGMRLAAFNYWQSMGLPYYYKGQTTQGTIICPYTDGHSGDKILDTLNLVNARLTSNYPAASAQDCVLLGPIEYNDASAATSLTTFRTQFDAVLNSINAYSPLIKTFIITGPLTPLRADITAYVAAEKAAYTAALGRGQNVFLVDYNAQAEPVFCTDNIHPSKPLGYDAMGNYVAPAVANLLVPASPQKNIQSSGAFGGNAASSGTVNSGPVY